jgi:exodeoxyribonuclease V alpha subunit
LHIIENEPEKLAAIRGINSKRARQISDWFRRQVGLRRLIEFLSQYGLKPQIAMHLYKYYGDESMDAVRENPYIIVGESIGADFFEADQLALQLGFKADAPQRVEAAVLFELIHNSSNGHSFLPRDKLIAATVQLIDVGYETIEDALDALCDGGIFYGKKLRGRTPVI